MSILKKVIALLLCVAMIIPVLASCDTGKSSSAGISSQQTQKNKSEQTTGDTKPPEETTDGAHTDEKPSEEIPDSPQPHAHTPASAVTENYVNSSCTQTGSYDMVVYCSECQEEISRTQNTINKKAHQYNQKVTTSKYLKSEATYTNSAVYYYSCTCGQKGTNTFSHGNPLVNNLTPTYSPTSDYSFYVVTGVTGSGTTLEIPSIYDGLRVVAIAENAFKNNTTLTKVTLPNTIETIGQNAFSGCTALSEINLPEESISSIGAYAFAGCTALKTISIPSKVTVLSEGVFQGCTKLKTVQLSDGLKTISNLAFDGCTALSAISLPNTVTSLGNMAFRHAEALTTVKLSTSLTAIGNATFQYCKSLSSVELHDKITTIGNSAFSYCYGLKTLRILGSISSWGNSTFYECTALENVYIEKSSTGAVPAQNYIFYNAGTAGNGIAFSYTCNITLPELLFVPNGNNNLPKFSSRTAVHNYPSTWTNSNTQHWHACQNSGCSSVSGKTSHTFGEWIVDTPATCVSTGTRHHVCTVCNHSISETVPKSHSWNSENTCTACQTYKDNGVQFSFNTNSNTYSVSDYTGSQSTVIIPSKYKGYDVTSIGNSAFSGCSGLTSITIPDSVTSIGNSAFSGCSALTSITIPFVGATKDGTSNTHFGYIFGASSPFYNDDYVPTSLKTVVITGGTSIGDCAFYWCSVLTSITIPDSVKSIGDYAFYWCSVLTSITIPDSVTYIGAYAFENCDGLTSITIPDSVTSIGSSAFRRCSGLTSITIPDSVTSIGDYAFYWCSVLTSITIPDSVKSIGDYAFYWCSGLTSITIPDSVTSIGKSAFSGCSRLKSITIPDSVTSIGDYAFNGCTVLTSIKYRGTSSQWSSIKKYESWNKNTGSYTITYNYTGE